jgi:hypothetical protein
VDGVTVAGLADAVRGGDIAKVRAMLAARPELVHMDMSEHNGHRALHYAVLDRNPEMVRVLMEHSADPFKGIWPHRDATGALTIATDAATTDRRDHQRSAGTPERGGSREPPESGGRSPEHRLERSADGTLDSCNDGRERRSDHPVVPRRRSAVDTRA